MSTQMHPIRWEHNTLLVVDLPYWTYCHILFEIYVLIRRIINSNAITFLFHSILISFLYHLIFSQIIWLETSSMSHHSDDNNLIASSDSFWEPGNYKRTTKRIEDGYKLCNDLIALIQERADIEKSYAKSLKGWAKKWNELIEKGIYNQLIAIIAFM